MLTFENFKPKNIEKRLQNAPAEYRQYLYSITSRVIEPDAEDFSKHDTEIEETLGNFEDIKTHFRDYGIVLDYHANGIDSDQWDSHGEENYRTGENTFYTLSVKRHDGNKLNKEELEELKKYLKTR